MIDDLDSQIAPIDNELRPLARANDKVVLLKTIPGIGDLLGLTITAEIGDISRLLRPEPDDQAIRSELAHRAALEGRAKHAALGGR